MPTIIQSDIDPGAVADYSTCAAWVADDYGAPSNDLVAEDVMAVGNLANTGGVVDASSVTWVGTTDATRSILLRGPGPTQKGLVRYNGAGNANDVDVGHLVIQDIDYDGADMPGNSDEFFRVSAGPFHLYRCILHDLDATQQDAIHTRTGDIDVCAINSWFYNIERAGIGMQDEGGVQVPNLRIVTYHCSFYDVRASNDTRWGVIGPRNGESSTNCFVDGSGSAIHCGSSNGRCVGITSGWGFPHDYMLCSDSASNAGNNGLNDVNFVIGAPAAGEVGFVAIDDLTLVDDPNNVAIDFAPVSSGNPDFAFIDDIFGTARPGTPDWDAGGYEISAGPPPGVELDGQSDIVTATSGSLSVQLGLLGQSDIVSGTSGNLQVARALEGQSDVVSSTSGQLGIRQALSGQSDIVSGTSGDLSVSTAIQLGGQSDILTTTSGSLSLRQALSGQSDVLTDTAADLTRVIGLTGQSDIVSVTFGDLAVGNIVPLAGFSDVVTGTDGSLSLQIALQGQSDVITTTSGNLSGVVALAGVSHIVTTTRGNLTGAAPMPTKGGGDYERETIAQQRVKLYEESQMGLADEVANDQLATQLKKNEAALEPIFEATRQRQRKNTEAAMLLLMAA